MGRSRGGRNTHTLADAKGRLIAILLAGGEAHDCPTAERLIPDSQLTRDVSDLCPFATAARLLMAIQLSLDLPECAENRGDSCKEEHARAASARSPD